MQLLWSGSEVLSVVKKIIEQGNQSRVDSELGKRCAQSIGLHLTMLIVTASDANMNGRHSCALSLFRAMEDALDCFAAASLIPGAAEKWAKGCLRSSDAARLWEQDLGVVTLPTGEEVSDYRKRLRDYFNKFAHCSPWLTDWNTYPDLEAADKAKITLDPDNTHTFTVGFHLNFRERLLVQNALRIGGFLAAHTFEFASAVEMAYDTFLEDNLDLGRALRHAKNRLKDDFEREFGAVLLEDRPPQLENLVIKHASDENLVQLIPLREAQKHDTSGDDGN